MALTGMQRAFVAAYLGKAAGCATRAARIAGYAKPEKAGWQVMRAPEVKAAIEARQGEIEREGLSLKSHRIAMLQERHRRLTQVMLERAEEMAGDGIPGGETGLLVRTAKLVKVYDAGRETGYQDGDACPKCDHGDGTPILRDGEVTNLITGERRTALLCPLCTERWHKCLDEERLTPIKQSVLVYEYELDTGLLEGLRKVEADIAAELGDRKQQFEHSGPGGAPIDVALQAAVDKVYGDPDSSS